MRAMYSIPLTDKRECRGHIVPCEVLPKKIVDADFAMLCGAANFSKVHTFRLQTKAFLRVYNIPFKLYQNTVDLYQ